MNRYRVPIGSFRNRRKTLPRKNPTKWNKLWKGIGWFFDKIAAPFITGSAIAALGIILSYNLFIIKERHTDVVRSYTDGIFLVCRRFGDPLSKTTKGHSGFTTNSIISVGSHLLEHWELLKDGQVLILSTKIHSALRDINVALFVSPDKISLYWLRGLALFKLGQYDWAILDFRHVQKKWHHFAKAGLALATAYCKLHKRKKALAVLINMKKVGLVTAATHNALGVIYLLERQQQNAIRSFNDAISLDPKYFLAYNNRGNYWRENGSYERALIEYNKAIAIKSDFAEAYNNRGITYLEKLVSKAKLRRWLGVYWGCLEPFSDIVVATVLKPILASAHHNCGLVFQKLGFVNLARKKYVRAIDLDQQMAMSHNNLGVLYHGQSKLSLAILKYLRAIECDPGLPPPYGNLGNAYWQRANRPTSIRFASGILGEYLRAIFSNVQALLDRVRAFSAYDKAIALKSDLAGVYNNRGIAYSEMELYDRAISDFNQATRLDKTDYRPRYNRATIFLICAEEMGFWHFWYYVLATLDYQTVISLNPDSADTYLNLSHAYLKLKFYKKAIESSTMAIELDPTEAMSYFNRGMAFFYRAKQKPAKLAGVYFGRAIRDLTIFIRMGGDGETICTRGQAYMKLGRYFDAWADEARAIGPGFNCQVGATD